MYDLNLGAITPYLLEALRASCNPLIQNERVEAEHKALNSCLEQSPAFSEMLHKMTHATMESPTCGVARIGMVFAILLGFHLAKTMLECQELTRQSEQFAN